jgi:hypothetical protein
LEEPHACVQRVACRVFRGGPEVLVIQDETASRDLSTPDYSSAP